MTKKIPEFEWRVVANMAVIAFQKIESGEACENAIGDCFSALQRLSLKYPKDSRPISSMGDLAKDVNQSFELYEMAYEIAASDNDYREMISTSTSALRLSIEKNRRIEIDRWSNRLLSIRHRAKDKWEIEEILDLLGELGGM